MANPKHLQVLSQGVEEWNRWREQNRDRRPDFIGADLRGAVLRRANMIGANLQNAILRGASATAANFASADLVKADLSAAYFNEVNFAGADLREASFDGTDLTKADFFKAELQKASLKKAILHYAGFRWADLRGASLDKASVLWAFLIQADLEGASLKKTRLVGSLLNSANFKGANLSGADMSRCSLLETNLTKADLSGCTIYGISAWDVELSGAVQDDLIISRGEDPVITVDNLEVAQFVYMLLNNAKIRDVVDTITSKVVLILGRFTPERKEILEKIRGVLRERNWVPVLFDFEKPVRKSFIETVSTLAHLARFVIADLTDAKVVLQELERIVPDLPSVPVQPLLLEGAATTVVQYDLSDYPWFLPVYEYKSKEEIISSLANKVIIPAETKAADIERKRSNAIGGSIPYMPDKGMKRT